MKKPGLIAPMVVMLLLAAAPVVLAGMQSGDGQVFGGFVFNPLDGNTYLAKMYQGWSGSWQFTLPYTAEQNQGAYLFLFYLFLGHAARVLQLPLIVMFHLARLVSAVLLVAALHDFFRAIFSTKQNSARLALWLALFGGGLGWLVSLAGVFTADFWVAEAYPFLSSYANPHFPLGMALLLWILIRFVQPGGGLRDWLILFVLGIILALVMPFGIVTAGVIAGTVTLWAAVMREKDAPWKQLSALAGGGIYLVYQYVMILKNPILAGWNAQNVTISPSLLNTIASFSPALLLSAIAVPAVLRRRGDPAARLLLVWFVLGFLFMYVPFDLQRRFMFAYYVPAVGMAISGLEELRLKFGKRALLNTALFGLSIPSVLVIVMTGLFALKSDNPVLRYSFDEANAMQWIETSTDEKAVVLTGPEMGLFIPARTGRRVLYGHPFETVNAEKMRLDVEAFYAGEKDAAWLHAQGVDFILYGPRERALGSPALLDRLPVVYKNSSVTIFTMEPPP